MHVKNTIKKRSLLQRLYDGIKKEFRALGPGFITGSADNDPSGIGTYSLAGAKYGPLMLWLLPFQLPLMYAVQIMSARIGLVTGKGLAANMKDYFPKPILYSAIAILVIANTINIGADISIMAASMQLVFGYQIYFWAIFTTLIMIALEIFVSYRTYSRLLLFLSSFLIAYIITGLLTTDDWGKVIQHTFTPYIQCDKEFLLIAAGFVGTTISPYLFFWQASQEIEEKLDHKTEDEIKELIEKMPKDTWIGMFFSQFVALFIVLTCYSALHKNGITTIDSAYDAAIALQPFAGKFAYIIFSVGIIGAGLLGIPILAGASAYALAEIFDYPRSLAHKFHQAKFFYGVIAISTLLGLCINFMGINPIQALLYAAIVNCFAAVPFILFLLILANKKELMGEFSNGYGINFLGIVTFFLMTTAALLPLWCR
ncbi:MAG TPA: Nramp family divalent metal transporter [Candidatus Babeliales bacterium]|nr:Nramp family divalent metal transporter [Candidatus Babeliales bacterium]